MASFQEAFGEKLTEIFSKKRDNASIPSLEKRNGWIERLLSIQREGPKESDDYNLRRKFALLRVGDKDWLIKKMNEDGEDYKFVIAIEEVYSAVMVAHSMVVHGSNGSPFKGLMVAH